MALAPHHSPAEMEKRGKTLIHIREHDRDRVRVWYKGWAGDQWDVVPLSIVEQLWDTVQKMSAPICIVVHRCDGFDCRCRFLFYGETVRGAL